MAEGTFNKLTTTVTQTAAVNRLRKDVDGKPVLDANGKPIYDSDAPVTQDVETHAPDFSSVNTATKRARYRKLISQTATKITCEYDLVTRSLEEQNDTKLKAIAITNAITALENGTATNAQVQNILAKVLRWIRKETIS